MYNYTGYLMAPEAEITVFWGPESAEPVVQVVLALYIYSLHTICRPPEFGLLMLDRRVCRQSPTHRGLK